MKRWKEVEVGMVWMAGSGVVAEEENGLKV